MDGGKWNLRFETQKESVLFPLGCAKTILWEERGCKEKVHEIGVVILFVFCTRCFPWTTISLSSMLFPLLSLFFLQVLFPCFYFLSFCAGRINFKRFTLEMLFSKVPRPKTLTNWTEKGKRKNVSVLISVGVSISFLFIYLFVCVLTRCQSFQHCCLQGIVQEFWRLCCRCSCCYRPGRYYWSFAANSLLLSFTMYPDRRFWIWHGNIWHSRQ